MYVSWFLLNRLNGLFCLNLFLCLRAQPYEAKDYGIIDEVIQTKTSHIPMPKMPSLFK